MSKQLLDTSALVEFFEGSEKGALVCGFIEEGTAATSCICIAELSDICARKKKNFDESFKFIQKHICILPLEIGVCAKAGVLKLENRKEKPAFGLVDALLYLIAKENSMLLVTTDNDFRNMENVLLLRD